MSTNTNKPIVNHGPVKKKIGLFGSIVSSTLQHPEIVSEDTVRSLNFKIQQKDARIRELEMYGVEKNEILRQRELLEAEKKKFQAEFAAFQNEQLASSEISALKYPACAPSSDNSQSELLKTKNEEIENLKTLMQRKVAEVLGDYEKLNADLQKSKSQITDLENTIQTSNKEIFELQEQNETLQSHLNMSLSQNEELKSTVTNANAQKLEAESQIDKNSKETQEKQAELEKKISRLEETIKEMEKTSDEEKMKDLRMARLTEEKNEEIKKREKAEKENEDLKKELEVLKNENEKITKEASDVKNEIEKMRELAEKEREKENVDEKVQKLVIKINEREKEIAVLNDMNEKLQQYCVSINKETKKIENDCARKIEEYVKGNEKRENEFAKMRDEVEMRRKDANTWGDLKRRIVSGYEKRLQTIREKGEEQERLKTALLLGENDETQEEKDGVLKMMVSAIIVALKLANPRYEATKETVVSLFMKIREEKVDVMEWPRFIQAFFADEIEG